MSTLKAALAEENAATVRLEGVGPSRLHAYDISHVDSQVDRLPALVSNHNRLLLLCPLGSHDVRVTPRSQEEPVRSSHLPADP